MVTIRLSNLQSKEPLLDLVVVHCPSGPKLELPAPTETNESKSKETLKSPPAPPTTHHPSPVLRAPSTREHFHPHRTFSHEAALVPATGSAPLSQRTHKACARLQVDLQANKVGGQSGKELMEGAI